MKNREQLLSVLALLQGARSLNAMIRGNRYFRAAF
jgi:hypothetical protein